MNKQERFHTEAFNTLKNTVIGPDCARLVLYHTMDPYTYKGLRIKVKGMTLTKLVKFEEHHQLAWFQLLSAFVGTKEEIEETKEQIESSEEYFLQTERMAFAVRRGLLMDDYRELFADRHCDYLLFLSIKASFSKKYGLENLIFLS
jgi:hypothetical protein